MMNPRIPNWGMADGIDNPHYVNYAPNLFVREWAHWYGWMERPSPVWILTVMRNDNRKRIAEFHTLSYTEALSRKHMWDYSNYPRRWPQPLPRSHTFPFVFMPPPMPWPGVTTSIERWPPVALYG